MGEMRKPALERRLDWMLGDHEGEAPPSVENNLTLEAGHAPKN